MCVRKGKRGVGGLIEGLSGYDIHVSGRNLEDCNPLFISSLIHF